MLFDKEKSGWSSNSSWWRAVSTSLTLKSVCDFVKKCLKKCAGFSCHEGLQCKS